MPELAEVEFHRRRWEGFHGSRVLAVDWHPRARVFRDSETAPLSTELVGRVFRDSCCHGKQIFLRFSHGIWIKVHLGMTGKLDAESPDYVPGPHAHWILRTRRASLVFQDSRMFGRVAALAPRENPMAGLPPAVNSPSFTAERVAEVLGRRKSAPLKSLLLDQEAFPGVGNWMADEILWRCHLHPATPVVGIRPGKAAEIWRETVFVARTAMEVIAPSWGDLPDTWLMNHRWKSGNVCPRPSCQSLLARETIAGRTTCWCPRCQS